MEHVQTVLSENPNGNNLDLNPLFSSNYSKISQLKPFEILFIQHALKVEETAGVESKPARRWF
jgi:hypothetical protein